MRCIQCNKQYIAFDEDAGSYREHFCSTECEKVCDIEADRWMELDEKYPSTEVSSIDVLYLDGTSDFNIRPVSVDMVEVEFWRESEAGKKRQQKETDKAMLISDILGPITDPNIPGF